MRVPALRVRRAVTPSAARVKITVKRKGVMRRVAPFTVILIARSL
jgi:hypothetical protein